MRVRSQGRSVLVDAAEGAVAGAAASFVMEVAQRRITKLGSEATRARERAATGDGPPATVQVAEAVARRVGRPLTTRQAGSVGGAVVHYATGTAWGAVFGVLAPRLAIPALLAGAAFGVAVWLVTDEAAVPALGFSKGPRAYPASTHAKGLAAHLVYGAATEASFRALARALR